MKFIKKMASATEMNIQKNLRAPASLRAVFFRKTLHDRTRN